MRLILLTCALATGCVTTGPTTALPDTQATALRHTTTSPLASRAIVQIETALRRYVAARAGQDWSAVYEQSAPHHRALVVRVARTIAESGRSGARAQGFDTVSTAESLSESDYYVHNRAQLARSGQYASKKTVTFAGMQTEGTLTLPYPEGRLRVHRFRVILSDGATERMGVTLERGLWRVLEN